MILVPKDRWIGFQGDVEDKSVSEIIGEINRLYGENSKIPICLFVSSGGGGCREGFTLYEFITRVLKPKIHTVAMGEVGSMAVPIFLAGSVRHITEGTTLFLHEISRTFNKDGSVKLSEVDAARARLLISSDRYTSIVLRRCGRKITKNHLLRLMRDNTSLTAKEAVKLGFAHSILS